MSFNKTIAKIENLSITDSPLSHLIVIRTEIQKKHKVLETKLNDIKQELNLRLDRIEAKLK